MLKKQLGKIIQAVDPVDPGKFRLSIEGLDERSLLLKTGLRASSCNDATCPVSMPNRSSQLRYRLRVISSRLIMEFEI